MKQFFVETFDHAALATKGALDKAGDAAKKGKDKIKEKYYNQEFQQDMKNFGNKVNDTGRKIGVLNKI